MKLIVAYRRLRVLQAARGLAYWMRLVRDREFRLHEKLRRKEFAAFCDRYLDVLASSVPGRPGRPRNALLIGFGVESFLTLELALAKTLEIAGYRPVIVTRCNGWLGSYYNLVRSARVVFWRSSSGNARLRSQALEMVARYPDTASLSRACWRGYRAGRGALADVVLKIGAPFEHWPQPTLRDRLVLSLAASLSYLEQAEDLIDEFNPALACMSDKMQSPEAEVLEVCTRKDVETIAYFDSSRKGAMIVQRVNSRNAELFSRMTLSDALWEWLRESKEITSCDHLLHAAYKRGKYYPSGGRACLPETHAAMLGDPILELLGLKSKDPQQLLTSFGFDTARKTAGIFPRPFWDTSFLWGRHLARDHAHWLIETVAAAIENDGVNWFIKLHPSYRARFLAGESREPPEVQFLQEKFGTLPRHVFLIPPTEDISSQALFELMNFCVTGSATVAVEAAMRGIPALTSVIGEHDRHGFTIDFETLEAYLTQLRSIETLAPLSPAQVDLAQRYAVGAFVLRPFQFTSVQEEHVSPGLRKYKFVIRSSRELTTATDVQAFANWLGRHDREDLHLPVICPECVSSQAEVSGHPALECLVV